MNKLLVAFSCLSILAACGQGRTQEQTTSPETALAAEQQLVNELQFVRKEGTNYCFLVRATEYTGRSYGRVVPAIVIPVSCDDESSEQ